MKLVVLALAATAVGAIASCGGQTATSTESAPLADTAAPTPTVSPQVAELSVCERVCERTLACLSEAMGDAPTEEERSAFAKRCPAQCGQQPPATLEAARACLGNNNVTCPELLSCLENIE